MSASAGRVLIIPRGDYNSATTYNMLDMVYFGGKSYICKQTSTGNDPTNTVYWQIMLDGASEFSALSDVELNNLQDGDGIYWDATAQKWKNTTPTSIAITSPPATVDYTAGDILDLTGIVVTAYYAGGSTRNVTSQCTFVPANGTTLSTSNTSITVTWNSFTATQAITVVDPIYGVEWDGSSSPVWTRTDNAVGFADPVPYYNGMSGTASSPFDNIMPWSGMEIIEDASAGTLVKIPKFYYKWTSNNNSLKLQISIAQKEGFFVSPAHMDRGDGEGERDYVYIGRYKTVTSSGHKSKTGISPDTGSLKNQRSWFSSNSEVWVQDFAMFWTIRMLYLVEFGNWNVQTTIGLGGSSSGNIETTGYTDNMPYHTGTTASARSSSGHVQYRYIEDLWANIFEMMDGIKTNMYYNLYVGKNPSDYPGSTGWTNLDNYSYNTGYEYTMTLYGSNHSPITGYEWTYLPEESAIATDTTYICDYKNTNSSPSMDQAFYTGGRSDSNLWWGLFFIATTDYTQTSTVYGGRLMKLPISA